MSAIPKILIRIKREKVWLGRFAAREGLDLVISDNRYGLTLPGTPCIFITHQLLIKTPFGPWADRLLQSLNYRSIRHFSRCWVPDMVSGGLAGDLSHPERMPPISTRYIGWLSRFGAAVSGSGNPGNGNEPCGALAAADSSVPLLLALLSGPEPQRTLFEKDIRRQAQAMAEKVHAFRLVIVRGLPGSSDLPPGAQTASDPAVVQPASSDPTSAQNPSDPPASAPPIPWLTIYNHLPAKNLEPLLNAASLVLARPGYSTVMDLERLGKRALFIPTPGQTEQEYLGPYLAAKGWAVCVDQHAFSLAQAVEMAGKGSSIRERHSEDQGLLAAEIKDVLNSLEKPAVPLSGP